MIRLICLCLRRCRIWLLKAVALLLQPKRWKERSKWPERTKKISDASYGIMLGDRLNFARFGGLQASPNESHVCSLPDGDNDCRVVGVTSSVRGEGKSTTTLNLAYSIAEAGQYVLVIEADMRLPTMAKRLGIDGSKGISNLLVGMSKGSEVMQRSSLHPNLYVLPAGRFPQSF